MSFPTRLLTLAVIFSATAFGTARFSGEKGARAHLSRLAAGERHTCAILDDGTVDCWGGNNLGQLGDGTHTTRLTPVPVPNLGTAISIAAGPFHTCAILSTAAVRCWGLNDFGQLGNGNTTDSSTPVAVSGLTGVISLATGTDHSCAVRVDGSVWCWGLAIANGSTVSTTVPVKVNISGAISVTAGANHTCALVALRGTVQCWGRNSFGQAANFNGKNDHSTPVPVTTQSGNVVSVFADLSGGGNYTCGREADDTVLCWGDDSFGQFGNRTTSSGTPFVTPSRLGSPSVALATGAAHTCAILMDGSVQCFGNNDDGQVLGFGQGIVLIPSTVTPIVGAVEIASGAKHTCAVIVDGEIRCWGDNQYGQHGDGTTGQVGLDSVAGINGTFLARAVTAGNQFSCGRRGLGALACWGAGLQGQLGDSANVASSNPVAVTFVADATAVSAGSSAHACLLDAVGLAKCWGDNSRGQLGRGTAAASNLPVGIESREFSAISTGDLHTCGIAVSGFVSCWGAGEHGQLGTGKTTDSLTPTPGVSLLALEIAAGSKFTCALIAFGTVSCWGDNSAGQIGTGVAGTIEPTPRDVGLQNVAGISAGAHHVCAVTAFGSVLCWGANSRGQIGNNTTNPALFPTTVPGITDAVSVSAGAFYTCAVHVGGTVSCWGANDAGELGTKDSGDHLTPTLVAASVFSLPTGGTTFIALSGVVAIATGTSPLSPTHEQTCALMATGVIKCWGDNQQGEIGDGVTTNASRPTLVNSFAANVDPAATLRNGRVAEVTVLIDCEEGDIAHIILTLQQGAASGTGHASARCEGRLVQVPVTVPAQGPLGFAPGDATASVGAIGTKWTRQVVLK